MSLVFQEIGSKNRLKNLNYRNYIYLFNNPNEIVISRKAGGSDSSDKIGTYFVNRDDQPNAAYEFLDSVNVQVGSPVSSNKLKPMSTQGFGSVTVFKDTDEFGDFPQLYNGQNNQQGLRKKEAAFNMAPSTLLNIGGPSTGFTPPPVDGRFKVTNDFGYSPKIRHEIRLDGANNYKYYFRSDEDNYLYFINFYNAALDGITPTDIEAVVQPHNPDTQAIRMTNLLTNRYWMKDNQEVIDIDIIKEDSFLYRQGMYFQVVESDASNFANFVQKFSGDIAKFNINSSTRIGVPYDIREAYDSLYSLKLEVGASKLTPPEANSPSPSYESIYNYYDPQFEEAAISLVSNGVLGETVLPSIYDFLYLSHQPKLISALVDIAGDSVDIENTTISNLNSYLDSLSSLYEKYTEGYLASIGGDSAFEGGSVEPLEFQFLNDLPEYNSDLVNFIAPSGLPAKTAKQQIMALIKSSEDYGNTLKHRKNQFVPKWLEEMKRGIYFSEKSMNVFNEAVASTNAFPFAMKISIPQENLGPIAKLLSESDFLDSINTHAASLVTPYNQTELPTAIFSKVKSYSNFYGALISDSNLKSVETGEKPYAGFNLYQEVKLKTFKMHFDNKLPNIGPSIYDGIDYENVDLFLDSFENINLESPKNVLVYTENETTESTTNLLELLNKLKSVKFFREIEEQLLDGLMRTPLDIHKGELAHEETLMYEIAKYEIVGDEEYNYIQSIFLPIVDQKVVDYLDTQVIPFKNYYYKIFAHKVIVGTAYKTGDITLNSSYPFQRVSDFDRSGTAGKYITFKHNYIVKPYLQFVRVPYYNVPLVNLTMDNLNFSRIEDLPPTPPQVQVVPYKNINNKVLFLFNNSAGEYAGQYIQIADSDFASQEAIRISQKTTVYGKVRFKSDDITRTYQIFRIEKQPATYRMFFTDDTAISFSIDSRAETAFVDTIMPNKDYYYTFRAIDVHGKLSNPTTIYKVRMVDTADAAPYLKVSSSDIDDLNYEKRTKKFTDVKTFQKYLLFGLNNEQNEVKYPDIELSDTEKAIGNHETTPVEIYSDTSGVFGANSILRNSKYKIRITSKQTGRKIDININLKNAKNIINDV